jgi:predicted metal-dependent hydrolase
MSANLPVEIIRSARRKRTVEAQVVNGTIRVHVPDRMKQADVERYTAELVARLQRAEESDRIDLVARATVLARRYKLPLPKSIRFVENQKSQWGSCTPSSGDIRLSSRLTQFPPWVLDYVIVHELAHLVEFHHNARFHALVDQYPKAERARGFLTGVHYSTDERVEADDGERDPVDVAPDPADEVTVELPEPHMPAARVASVAPPMKLKPIDVATDCSDFDYRPTLF